MIGFGKGGIWDISHLSIFLPLLAVELVVASLTQGVSFVGQRIGSFLSFIPTLKTTVLGGIQFGASAREYLILMVSLMEVKQLTDEPLLFVMRSSFCCLVLPMYFIVRSLLVIRYEERETGWVSKWKVDNVANNTCMCTIEKGELCNNYYDVIFKAISEPNYIILVVICKRMSIVLT